MVQICFVNIHQYLDSTYLKTSEQAQISEHETLNKVRALISEAIKNRFKSVMIRPQYVSLAKQHISNSESDVLIGTVIGFHEGTHPLVMKLSEAEKAISDGVDELDIVINYKAFIKGDLELVKQEIIKLTRLALDHHKTIKWIIEVAALTNDQIKNICRLIKETALTNFGNENAKTIFVKSSTGFFKTMDNKPNGATLETIRLMLEYASPLPVKAAGGIKSYHDAVKMINLGVLRIGASSAKEIADGGQTKNSY